MPFLQRLFGLYATSLYVKSEELRILDCSVAFVLFTRKGLSI